MILFRPKPSLSDKDVEKGLKSLLIDGSASQIMATFTGGVFLVALALEFGASNTVIGFLAAIPALTQLVQIPSTYLIEKIRNRRLITVVAAFLSRAPWILVALTPFLPGKAAGLSIVILAVFLSSVFGSVAGCSWSSWVRDLVPENRMGSFFSKRTRMAIGFGLIISLVVGVYLDWWKKGHPENVILGYSPLFLIGFIAGIIGVIYLSIMPEPEMKPAEMGFIKSLFQPFKNKNFKRLLIFLGSWSFTVNLAAPFFTVYMLGRLETGMSLVVILSVVSQAFNFGFIGLWGRYTDRFSNKSVLAVSGPLFMLCILAWTFTTFPEKHFLTLPLVFVIHMLMGVATAGITIASGNIGLKLAPKGQATAYLAAISVVNAVAASIAPIIGGRFADYFATRSLSLTLNWTSPGREIVLPTLDFRHWDFFFVTAFFIGIYAMHRLSMVEETGEVDDNVVRDELIGAIKQPLRSLSSAAGVFQIISFPIRLLPIKTVVKKFIR
ncbi:MFS transporter [bacterium F11]|nr:MFS transporter [bacterium F11]